MGGRFGEILLVLIVALLLFGPSKLPNLAKALGEAIREFKKAANTDSDNQSNADKTSGQPASVKTTASPRTSTNSRRRSVIRRRSKRTR